MMHPIAGHPAARRDPRGGRGARRRAAGRPQGARRAPDARRPRPQRPRPGLRAGHRRGRRLHVGRAVQPRHAHRVHGRRRGRADGRTAFDVLAACFPAGTLSGAPKPRAMEIIEELEPTRRGLYGGCVGYLDFAGDLDTAIAIRTALPARRHRLRAGRRRDRRRLRPGRRGRRVPQQGDGGAARRRDSRTGAAAGAVTRTGDRQAPARWCLGRRSPLRSPLRLAPRAARGRSAGARAAVGSPGAAGAADGAGPRAAAGALVGAGRAGCGTRLASLAWWRRGRRAALLVRPCCPVRGVVADRLAAALAASADAGRLRPAGRRGAACGLGGLARRGPGAPVAAPRGRYDRAAREPTGTPRDTWDALDRGEDPTA